MTSKLFGRYDAAHLGRLFNEEGVYEILGQRGFHGFEVTLRVPEYGISHTALHAVRRGRRVRLLDACVTEAAVRPETFGRIGFALNRPVELLSVFWVREEDPTREFEPGRLPLPLQRYPGLGVLREVFRVVVRVAREIGKDGVACVPKFFHDAVIFYRSRLFLFLDPAEEGRFEALMRDLAHLPIGTASLALIFGSVTGAEGRVAAWESALQVFPLSDDLCAYFNSGAYTARVDEAVGRNRFSVDLNRLDEATSGGLLTA